jgi:hypothetical protein
VQKLQEEQEKTEEIKQNQNFNLNSPTFIVGIV